MRVIRNCRLALLLSAWAAPALAAPPPISVPTSGDQASTDGGQTAGFLGNLEKTNYLLGDLFGVRSALAKYGISLAVQETSEILGNATGGTPSRRGL